MSREHERALGDCDELSQYARLRMPPQLLSGSHIVDILLRIKEEPNR